MSKSIPHYLLFIASFLWGINFISMKYLTTTFPPFSLIFIRFFIAALFLWCLLWLRRKKDPTLIRLQPSDYKSIFFTGFTGMALYFYFQLFAFYYLTANMAALICATIPIFSLLGQVIFYKKKSTFWVYVLSLLCIVGVFLVLDMKWSALVSSGILWGIFFMVASIISWIVYTMTTGQLQKKYGSLSCLTFQSTVGAVLLSITAIVDIQPAFSSLLNNDNRGMILVNLLFIGIGSSALAYLFYIEGMKRIGIQLSSLYMNVIPIITAIASFLLFKEQLSLKQVLGMVVVLLSIYGINRIEQAATRKKEKLSPALSNKL